MLLSTFVSKFYRALGSRFKPVVAPLKNLFSPKLDPLEDRCLMASDFFAIGSPAGVPPLVKLLDSNTGQTIDQFQPFSSDFTGGLNVVLADLNFDNQPDIITAAGAGGGPHVKVFDGKTHQLLSSFFAYDSNFTGGLNIAAGDIGNGLVGIVTAPNGLMGPNVRVFSPTGELLKNFNAYESDFTGGVKVALGYAENGNAAIFTAAGLGVVPMSKSSRQGLSTFSTAFTPMIPSFREGSILLPRI